jgi:hypothetical protein
MTASTVPASPRLVIVCPVYRDAAAFAELRRRVQRVAAELASVSEVRFVVTDDTAGEDDALAAMRGRDTEVLVPPYNLGHQGAIVFALRELAPLLRPDDIVVTMDSDGEDRPEDLPALLAPLTDDADDLFLVAVARRTRRQEALVFRLSYLVFKAVFKLLTGVVVRSGNFAAMRGALVVAAIGHPSFDQCYSSSLISLPFRRRDVPIARGTRYSGQSRMGFIKLVTHGMHMLMPFLERIAVRCLLLSSMAGGLTLAAIVVFAAALMLGNGVPGAWVDQTVFVRWAPLLIGLLVAAGFGVMGALTLFAAAAPARARSVRVLHAEHSLGARRPPVPVAAEPVSHHPERR